MHENFMLSFSLRIWIKNLVENMALCYLCGAYLFEIYITVCVASKAFTTHQDTGIMCIRVLIYTLQHYCSLFCTKNMAVLLTGTAKGHVLA